MTTRTQAAELADAVAAHVATTLDLGDLAADPFHVLREFGLDIAVVDPASLRPGCSIAATYDRHSQPPRIRVSDDLSAGRRSFSLLHEYTHHVRDEVEEFVEALWVQIAVVPGKRRIPRPGFALHVVLSALIDPPDGKGLRFAELPDITAHPLGADSAIAS